MSLNQSKAERSEAQLRKPGKFATTGHQRGSNVPGKGGGAGGSAPPGSTPTASTSRGGKRPNGPSNQSRGTSNSNMVHTEPDVGHKVQNGAHDQSQHQQPSVPAGASGVVPSAATKYPNASASKSSRALPRPPTSQALTPPISEPASPVPTTVAPGEVSRAMLQQPFAFQFGSISPGFINGMQIPARTSSAPPNLDEQKRERARFEAVNATSSNKVATVSPGAQQLNGPQLRKDQDGLKQASIISEPQPIVQGKRNLHVSSAGLPAIQTQKPPLLSGVGISPSIQFQQSQASCTAVQMQYSVPSSQIQSQVGTPAPSPLPLQLQMATAAQAQVQQHVYVPQNLQSHSLQSQGMVHQGQALNFSQLNQISHQIGSQLGAPMGAQLPMGMGPQYVSPAVNQYIPQRTNKAVKITHPETHEELRFDKKSDSYVDIGSPGSTSLPGRLPANGLPQSRPSAPFNSSHPMNFYSAIQTGSYSHPSTYFPPPKTSVPTVGGPSSSAPSVRYSFVHSTSGQNIPFMSHSGFSMPPVVKPGSAGVSTSEYLSSGSAGSDGHAPLVSVPAVLGLTQATVHAAVPATSQKQGSSPSLPSQLGDTPQPSICRGDPSHTAMLNSSKQFTHVVETDLAPQKFGDLEASVSMSSIEKDASVHSSLFPNSAAVLVPGGVGISESQSITSTTDVPASKTFAAGIKQSTIDMPVAALSKPSGTVVSSSPSIPATEVGASSHSGEIRRTDSVKRSDIPSREHTRKTKQRPQKQQQQVPSTVSQHVSSSSLASKPQVEGKEVDVSEPRSSNFGIAQTEAEKPMSTQISSASKPPSQKMPHGTTLSLIESDDIRATSQVASEFNVRGNPLELSSQQVNSEFAVAKDENSLANAKQHSSLGTSVLEATMGALAHVSENTEAVVDGLNFGDFVEATETKGSSISKLSNIDVDSGLRDTNMQCFKAISQVDETSVSNCVSVLPDSPSTLNKEKPPVTVDSEPFITNERTVLDDPNTLSPEVGNAVSESQQNICIEDTLDHDGSMASEVKGDSLPDVAELRAVSNEACEIRGKLVAGVSARPDVSSMFGQSAIGDFSVPSCDKVSDFDLVSGCRDEKDDTSGCGSEPGEGDKSKLEVVAAHDEVLVSTSNVTCGDASFPYHQASVSVQSEVKKLDLSDRGTEKPSSIISSNMLSASRDKQGDEQQTKPKLVASKKKKKKEILIKADAAGTAVDLYNAYKAPEGKREEVSSQEVFEVVPSAEEKTSIKECENKTKNELDDWEDAVEIISPKVNTTEGCGQVSMTENQVDQPNARSIGDRKYTRDFLLTFRDHFRDLPSQFEIQADMEHILNLSAVASHLVEHEAGLGRVLDRQLSGGPRLERRGSNMGDEDRWMKSSAFSSGREMRMEGGFGGPPGGFRPGQGINAGLLRNVRGSTNNPFMSGILPGGPMMQMPIPQGGIPRNNSDADRWQRASSFQRGLIPSPQNTLPAIHKAENRYEVGKVSDEEESKQRQLKAILNKLTPQNFEKLFEQVKEVNIDSAITLNGVISQIYDKALTEPTFCEMYANFCVHLAEELPKFNEDNEKITFKRVLLNKCQEEFQRGEREQAEADRLEEDGEVKLSEEEREQKRIKAHRRMLGNIRFIGELYKKKMLTERIMHECIKKLLGEYQNPDEENVEALCKLMSTIGHMIDHSKAKEHIDAYFDRMTKLSNNQKLSSRLRFMLKDVIDLRKNGWQQRRKVEGPKKIEEVHRDAVQERQAQGGRLTRGPSMGSLGRRPSQASDYGLHGAASQMYSPSAPMGPLQQMGGAMRGPPSQMGLRGYGGQDVRLEDRHPLENRPFVVPLSQRLPDEVPLTLGPQGGLGRGMSVRGQLVPTARSTLADVPPNVHGDSRRMGSGSMPSYNPHSGSADRITHVGRDEVLSRNPSIERASYLFEKPSLEKSIIQERSVSGTVARDFRSSDRSLDKAGIAANHGSRFQGDSLSGIQQSLLEKVQPSEERLREMCMLAIKEFYSVRDMNEAVLCVEDLKSPTFYPTMVSLWITDSFDRKDIERDLLSKLLINLCKSEPYLINHMQLIKGFEVVLSSLEDTVVDAPRAPEFLGGILAKIILAGIVSFGDVARLTKEGGLEPGSLLEMGLALDVLGSVLDVIRRERGEAVLSDIYRKSGLRLEDYMSPNEKRPGKFDAFLEKKNIQCLYPLIAVEKQIRELLVHDEPVEEILEWVEKNVPSSMQSDSAFLRMVITQVLRRSVPLPPVDYESVLKGKIKAYTYLLRQFAPGRHKQRQYIAAIQLFANELGHPSGLMTALFRNLYINEVISEETFFSWQDDVRDPTPGRDQAIREVGKWLSWLSQAPEAED